MMQLLVTASVSIIPAFQIRRFAGNLIHIGCSREGSHPANQGPLTTLFIFPREHKDSPGWEGLRDSGTANRCYKTPPFELKTFWNSEGACLACAYVFLLRYFIFLFFPLFFCSEAGFLQRCFSSSQCIGPLCRKGLASCVCPRILGLSSYKCKCICIGNELKISVCSVRRYVVLSTYECLHLSIEC